MYEALEGCDIRDLHVYRVCTFQINRGGRLVDQRGSDRVECESELWICYSLSVLVFPCFNFLIWKAGNLQELTDSQIHETASAKHQSCLVLSLSQMPADVGSLFSPTPPLSPVLQLSLSRSIICVLPSRLNSLLFRIPKAFHNLYWGMSQI